MATKDHTDEWMAAFRTLGFTMSIERTPTGFRPVLNGARAIKDLKDGGSKIPKRPMRRKADG